MPLISVAVPVPFLDALTYSVPPHIPLPPVGARVRVPIGSRTVTGCVVAHDSSLPPQATAGSASAAPQPAESSAQVKDIAGVVDDEPFVPAAVVELCRWVAEYYVAGVGDALAAAMPPGASRRASGFRKRRVAALTAQGLSWSAAPTSGARLEGPREEPEPGLTDAQVRAVQALAGAAAGLRLTELRDRGVSAAVLARLAARGFVQFREDHDERDPFEHAVLAPAAAAAPRELTIEQTVALEALSSLAATGEFRVALLHGVTGSGKTEIYQRLAEDVRQRGRQVLLMVPEIALTPAVAALFRCAFGDRLAIQHSGLSDGERHDQWHRIRRGAVDIVIGTRSAVFAPLSRLGLVIVDEEHDSSYKQEEAPRYHGRDVAIMRASREGALVVLGSATPALETYQHAESGKYARVVLRRRVHDRPLAAVRVVNMREEYAESGPDVVISRALETAIGERLPRREQVVVLLNRRGYATAVFCRQCGDTFECPNCSISLTVHGARDGWRAHCHYCAYGTRVPKACRKCAAPYLEYAGFGTEKVERHLRELFPDARIGRVDRDSVRRKGTLASLLGRFAAGELDVLVGTQMIAKGHDFPRVTLVGVISADIGLGLADFRAAERTFQLLTQVAGRAGRGDQAGEAIVQTLYPEHYSVRLACRQDYPAFYEKEITYRRAMRYPPVVALVNTIVRGRTFSDAMETAMEIVRRLETVAAGGSTVILGPAPAPLARLRGEHRVQFFLKGGRRADLRNAVKAVLAGMPDIRRRVTIDVDPLNVL